MKAWESTVGTNGIVPNKNGCWYTRGQLIVEHFDGFTEADRDACPPCREQDLDQLCSVVYSYTDQQGDDCSADDWKPLPTS